MPMNNKTRYVANGYVLSKLYLATFSSCKHVACFR